ncbi:adenylosuccinate synthase [Sporolactobacillus spathodeae]|uniref:Adenylosuccinate synthetase n=1 Tax=Sporolactobacillus spathodeae TaxID=1465502 RepID=A0ABS2Q663_9BACL|nr:adenylosuccinate synthase [Sporolactobacillus spathodeae]MBM7656810.1 adenylosuccinate synthase [Sporolactobacillus spathodeae]
MSSVVVVGAQWGDEGKGKITDYLSENSEVVSRYQGGDNAGHTIVWDGKTYKLRLMPSGILYKDKICVLGNGMVINPKSLCGELDYMKANGVSTDNLRISSRAHIILPYHLKLDVLEEESKGASKIGTTQKGIGPAYMDKAARIGIRMADLLEPETFKEKLEKNLAAKNRLFEKMYECEGFNIDEIYGDYLAYGERLRPLVCDTSAVLNNALDAGKRVLFEGAQGCMLDIDQGTYPFVTSSNPVAGGVTIGAGVGPTKINHVVGCAKAYTTRVGDGPFPTELNDAIGDQIREIGHEYGTVTGRPRRVGWFDSVVLRHSRRVSGLTDLSLNCVDVLTGLESVKICTAYEYEGRVIEEFPASLNVLAKCKPIYEEMPGWSEDITQAKSLAELPVNARHYIERISQLSQVPLTMFSVGPDRKQTIEVRSAFA